MYEIVVKADFAAAHRLEGDVGLCANIHGHNWIVELTVASEELDEIGMVVDFRDLKKDLKKTLSKLDHQFLNELDEFKNINPTAENIAKYIYQQMSKSCEPLRVKEVRVWENERNSVRYYE